MTARAQVAWRAPAQAPVLRRTCSCAGSGHECESCRVKGPLRGTGPGARGSGSVLAIVHEVLGSEGQPLDSATRAFMDARFGHDFSRVRTYTGARAAESARAVGAAAYTVGPSIVFAEGRYAPHGPEGRRLLAHELAHTIQQPESPPFAGDAGDVRVGPPHDDAEHEADRMAERVAAGGKAPHPAPRGAAPVLLRQGEGQQTQPSPKPLIPIPVFDQLDPVVRVPDVKGVPDFIRGQELKLSDVQKAMDVFRGKSPFPSGGGGPGFCERFGMEEPTLGPFTGLCCKKTVARSAETCCKASRIDAFQSRCCTGLEINIQGHCVKLQVVPPKMPAPTPPKTTPVPPMGSGAPAVVIPVPAVVFFERDRPAPSVTGEAGLRTSATPQGSKSFDDLVRDLNANPTFKVQLTGKASSEGTPEYNRKLGERRVRLVADALVAKGIDRSRIADQPGTKGACPAVEAGLRNCGETGAAATTDPADRQVRADVFDAGAASPTSTGTP